MGKRRLGTFSSDSTSELDILGHDGHSLGVDGTQVGVLKETDEVGLGSLLQGHHGRPLESEIGLEVLSNLSYQSLEGEFADEELGALLVATDLPESNSSGPVPMGFLDPTSRRGRLSGSLGGKLLSRSLPSGRFTSGLLCTRHASDSNSSRKLSARGKHFLIYKEILTRKGAADAKNEKSEHKRREEKEGKEGASVRRNVFVEGASVSRNVLFERLGVYKGWFAFALHSELFRRSVRVTHFSDPISCLDEAKEERGWGREEPSAIARCCEITSRVSPSPPFVVWLDEEA